jgi:hypothetical protein
MRGFVYLNFSRGTSTHRNKWWVEVTASVGVGELHEIKDNIEGDVDFATAVDDLVDTLMKPMFHSGIEFQSAELWIQATDEDNPTFAQLVPLGIAGTSATATTVGLCFAVSVYNEQGNAQKLILVEASGSANVVENAPYGAGNLKNFTDFLVSDGGWIRSKSGWRLVANKRYVTKIYDALRKKSLGL